MQRRRDAFARWIRRATLAGASSLLSLSLCSRRSAALRRSGPGAELGGVHCRQLGSWSNRSCPAEPDRRGAGRQRASPPRSCSSRSNFLLQPPRARVEGSRRAEPAFGLKRGTQQGEAGRLGVVPIAVPVRSGRTTHQPCDKARSEIEKRQVAVSSTCATGTPRRPGGGAWPMSRRDGRLRGRDSGRPRPSQPGARRSAQVSGQTSPVCCSLGQSCRWL